MANNDIGVTMSIAGYNQIKSDNTKFNMFLDRLFDETVISSDNASLLVDDKFLDSLIRLCFPERYKKRLSYLRGLNTKIEMKKLKEAENESDD